MMEDVEPIPITSGANLGRTCSNLRPPAVVTEFMSQGSVKSALARKSEVVVGNMHRVVVAMDAAKVGARPCSPQHTMLFMWKTPGHGCCHGACMPSPYSMQCCLFRRTPNVLALVKWASPHGTVLSSDDGLACLNWYHHTPEAALSDVQPSLLSCFSYWQSNPARS